MKMIMKYIGLTVLLLTFGLQAFGATVYPATTNKNNVFYGTNTFLKPVGIGDNLTVSNAGAVIFPVTNSAVSILLGAYGTTNDQPNLFFGTGFAPQQDNNYGNISIGQNALQASNNCQYNVGIGLYSLQQLQSGNGNVGLGVDTLSSLISGNDNITIGHAAGGSITNGGQNVAIGQTALGPQTPRTSSNNVAIGQRALAKYVRSESTALGYNALTACVSNEFNTAIGVRALGSHNTPGGQFTKCTAVGYQAASGVTSGRFVTAVGAETLQSAFIADYACAFGGSSLNALTSGNRNSGFGAGTLSGTTSGSDNTGLGDSAGNAITTGRRNVIIGSAANVVSATTSNAIAIGYGITSPSFTTTIGTSDTTNTVIPFGDMKIAGALTVTNGIYYMATSNGVVSTNVIQPLHTFAALMGFVTNTINGGANTYAIVTNYSTARTNLMSCSLTAGTITNTIAGYYYVAIHMSMISLDAGALVEGDLLLNGVERDEVSFQTQFDPGTPRYKGASAFGILYIPANSQITFQIKSSGASGIELRRQQLVVMPP